MRRLLLLTLVVGLLGLWPATGMAADVTCPDVGDFPCGVQLDGQALKRAPTLFRLQARVAQAGMQIGEAQFETVMVKVLRGSEVLCREKFQQVRIKASVMNLQIGAEIDCELDEVMARNTDLGFQICIGTDDTCLPPIPLQSTPYAVRATWTWATERAYHTDRAAQAHYAHRLTADRDLLSRNTLGTGYFDTQTPAATAAADLYEPAEHETYADSGFLQWTPVRHREAMAVHVTGKHHGTDRLRDLDELVLSTRLTRARGGVRVAPRTELGLTVTGRGAHVVGASDLDGSLLVAGGVTMEQDLAVALAATVGGALTVGTGMIAQSSLHATGDSDIDGLLVVGSPTTVTGGAQISGDSKVMGLLTVTAADADHAMRVLGDLDVLGAATFGGAVHVTGGAEATTSLLAATATLGGGSSVNILDVGGKLTVAGDVVFADMVTFMGGRSKPEDGPNLGFVQYGERSETGFHAWQTDDPCKVATQLDSREIERYFFKVESVGQFDVHWSCWVCEKELREAGEE